jgi:hypothetical protein
VASAEALRIQAAPWSEWPKKRFSAGLTFLGSLTYSKNMDGSFSSTRYYTSSSTVPQNSFDLGPEYGLAIVNTPLGAKGPVFYELPFGKGKHWLISNKWLDYAVGGWQANVVMLFQSGFPLAVTQGTNFNSVIGTSVQRPNATGVSGSVFQRAAIHLRQRYPDHRLRRSRHPEFRHLNHEDLHSDGEVQGPVPRGSIQCVQSSVVQRLGFCIDATKRASWTG